MSKKLLGLLGIWVVACLGTATADEEVVLSLKGTGDYGSGPSVMDNLYTPGGVAQVGLFLGNPNSLIRRDRVLLKYDIKPLLLSASRIKSAALVFHVDFVVGAEEVREIMVEHFSGPVDTLAGPNVNSPEVEEVAVVEVSQNDALNGGSGSAAGQPKEVDVTEALKNSLSRGDTSCGFRLKDTLVESAGASMDPAGIVIVKSEAKLPILRVILND